MAAPTNVRVESNSLTTATLRWTYGGAAPIAVYRSTDGVAYSEITDALTRVAAGTLLYADSSLAVATKYWYKLSDDAGLTFSSVVTVITQACLAPAGSNDTFSLPRADAPDVVTDPDTGEVLIVDKFNNLSERIENVLGGRVLNPNECIVCPQDGAIILNCAGHCRQWTIVADEDINSISLQYCDEGDGNIDFVIPPNVTRRITGWPNGFGSSGDEPGVVSGSNGRTVSVPTTQTGGKAKPTSSNPSTGRGIGSGGGTGAGNCNCTAVNGALTIKSCNANNSLNCASTKRLQLIACGGRAPYTWTKTGSIILSATTGSTTNVTPPPNAGSAVAGTAYIDQVRNCNTGGGCTGSTCTTANPSVTAQYGCDDAYIAGSCLVAWGGANCATPDSVASVCCPTATHPCTDGSLSCPNFANSDGYRCQLDVRTAPMIAAGCVPCGGAAAGATVTVTDAIGVQTTIILRP